MRIARPAVSRSRGRPYRKRLGELEQVVDVVRPRGARLLDQCPEDPMVAGEGARVRGRSGCADCGRTDLEHGHADALVRAHGKRLAQPRAVAVGLHEHRDRADVRLAGEVLDPVRRRDDRLVPARHRGVQPQPPPRRQRVDHQVAALGDERDVTGLRGGQRVTPQRGSRVQRDQAVAVRSADGQLIPPRSGSQGILESSPPLELSRQPAA